MFEKEYTVNSCQEEIVKACYGYISIYDCETISATQHTIAYTETEYIR